MRALDPRLVRRAAPVRILLGLDTGLGVATAILVIVQATLLARVVAQRVRRRFARRCRTGDRPARACLRRARCVVVGLRGRGRPRRVGGALGFPARARRSTAPHTAGCARRRRCRRDRGRRGPGSGRPSRVFRPLPPPGRARVRRAARGGRLGRGDRPHVGPRHARDAAARPGLHVAHRSLHRGADPRALGRAPPALNALPRHRPWTAHVAAPEPEPRTGGDDRRRRAIATGARRWGRSA